MPLIPAICNDCQAVFPSGVNLMAQNVAFQGCGAGPCPRCGGKGTILDGVYSALDNVIHALLGHPTPELFARLARILDEATRQKLPRDAIVDNIEQQAPELRGIGKYLPQDCTQLCVLLGIIGAAIAFVASAYRNQPNEKPQPTPQIIQEYIDNSVNLFYTRQHGERESQQ